MWKICQKKLINDTGIALKMEVLKGEFTRSGDEGQYHEELKPETIEYLFNQFLDFKKLYTK